jgi:hypothetical protein
MKSPREPTTSTAKALTTPKALTCAYTCIVFQRISQSSLRRYEYCLVFPLDYGSLSPDRIAERRDSQAI